MVVKPLIIPVCLSEPKKKGQQKKPLVCSTEFYIETLKFHGAEDYIAVLQTIVPKSRLPHRELQKIITMYNVDLMLRHHFSCKPETFISAMITFT